MVERLYKKGLVIGIIILFIGVGIQPTSANDISISKEITEKNNDSDDWGYGFIFVSATFRRQMERTTWRLRWTVIDCIDLETGKVVMQEKTGMFGFCLFKFLPRGHDYRLIVPSLGGSSWCVIEDMGLFHKVRLHVDEC